jgi:hypothetical protein
MKLNTPFRLNLQNHRRLKVKFFLLDGRNSSLKRDFPIITIPKPMKQLGSFQLLLKNQIHQIHGKYVKQKRDIDIITILQPLKAHGNFPKVQLFR